MSSSSQSLPSSSQSLPSQLSSWPYPLVPDLVLYHGNCPDGFTSAWVFWREFGDTQTKYIPCVHGSDPPNVDGKVVVIVDFSYKRPILEKMVDACKHLFLLDHHVSAKTDLAYEESDILSKATIIFDMDRSGAQLAWDFLHPSATGRPAVVEYVADRDLWKHRLPHTKEISFALNCDGYFESFQKLNEMYGYEFGDPKIDAIVEKGKWLLQLKDKEVEEYAKDAVSGTLITKNGDKYKMWCSQPPPKYISDIGHVLVETKDCCDVAVLYRYDPLSDQWWISLRASSKRADIDVSKIASSFGGGGHAKAAGFALSGLNSLCEHLVFDKPSKE